MVAVMNKYVRPAAIAKALPCYAVFRRFHEAPEGAIADSAAADADTLPPLFIDTPRRHAVSMLH